MTLRSPPRWPKSSGGYAFSTMSRRPPISVRRSWWSASSPCTPTPSRAAARRWNAAAPRSVAEPLVDAFAAALRALGAPVQTGVFGAHMNVELVNDGPVTVLLEL